VKGVLCANIYLFLVLECVEFIRKLLLRLLWFFRRTAALFRQIRTFPQLFRFESILGNSGIWAYPTNCEIFNADGKDES